MNKIMLHKIFNLSVIFLLENQLTPDRNILDYSADLISFKRMDSSLNVARLMVKLGPTLFFSKGFEIGPDFLLKLTQLIINSYCPGIERPLWYHLALLLQIIQCRFVPERSTLNY